MKHIILLDTPELHCSMLPLTFTRPVSEITIGFGTIKEKWEKLLPGSYSYSTIDYLSELFPLSSEIKNSLVIMSNILPNNEMVEAINALVPGDLLTLSDGTPIAMCGFDNPTEATNTKIFDKQAIVLRHTYDIFLNNDKAIKADFEIATSSTKSLPISSTNTIIGNPDMVFIAEGATAEGVIFNTKNGPIYIDADAEVMEGSCLRGPIYIGKHATVNMATKIYGATTIGTHCKVGGEINNVVMHPYSNKAHDGFLGNSVIGSWCNLGAGCVASNLKNDYTEIKLWDYHSRRFMRTGLQFCGLIMGDHSKAGINTMFNTATVVGVGVNIHGTGFPRNFVASFSEGSAGTGFSDVALNKFFSIAERMMARRNITLTEPLRHLYTALFELTEENK